MTLNMKNKEEMWLYKGFFFYKRNAEFLHM